jgi:hypothetical protein
MQQLFDAYTQIAYTDNAMAAAPMTVVETERFLKDTKLLMSDAERAVLVEFVGTHPESGEVMPWDRWRPEDPLGLEWQRQAGRRASVLLLP